MIDLHTHFFYEGGHTEAFQREADLIRGSPVKLAVTPEEFDATMSIVDRAVLLSCRALLVGLKQDNDVIARFAARNPAKYTAFAGIDPCEPRFMDELERCFGDLKMRGVKLLPMYAGFDPRDRRLDPLYERCQRDGLPILFHTGTTFCRDAPMRYTRPILWEEVAERYRDLKMVVAHLGHPWEHETVALVRKQPNIWADVSALHYRPWQLYNSLMLVQEYGVWKKLLFGSDYPVTTPQAQADGMRSLNEMLEGTRLPRLNMDSIEQVIQGDSFKVLNLA
jgi:predicted TIM-barrel fold metal-dependent hydrolase